jgi:hypothetical protein
VACMCGVRSRGYISMDAMVVGRRRKSESSSPYAGDETPAEPRVLCVPNDGSLLQARLI